MDRKGFLVLLRSLYDFDIYLAAMSFPILILLTYW
jgi:hypothetical protein